MRRLVLPILLSLLFASCINKNNYAEARYEIPIANYDIEEIYLERSGYSISFNPITNIPNWVAWTLNQEKLIERETRSNKFLPDPDINPSILSSS